MCKYCVPAVCLICGSLLCEECNQCPAEGHDKECSQDVAAEKQ